MAVTVSPSVRRRIRSVAGAAAVFLLLAVIFRQREEIGESLAALSWVSVGASFVFVVLGLLASLMAWRALLRGLGSPLEPAVGARIFFLSQLGKYAPGSVWPILAQAELGRDHGVPRTRSAVAALLALAVGVVTACSIGIPALLLASQDAVSRYAWLGLVGMATIVVLHPAFLERVVGLAYRIRGHGGKPEPVRTRDMVVATGWSVLMWLLFAVHCYLIASDLVEANYSLYVLCVGAVSISWLAGFLVVFAPAGVGAREAAMVLVLAPVMSSQDALTLALVSRVLMMLADLVVAVAAFLGTRARRPPGSIDSEPVI